MAKAEPKTEPKWIKRKLEELPRPDVTSASWYAIYCNVQCERKAAWGLIDRGFDVFVPLSRRWVQPKRAPQSKEKTEIVRPAFVRYLFVGMRYGSSWWDLRRTEGIEGVVCNNLEPVRIHHKTMEQMIKLDGEGFFNIGKKQQEVTLTIGEHITILSGPFEGYSAVVESLPDKWSGSARVVLNDVTVVTMPMEMVQATQAA